MQIYLKMEGVSNILFSYITDISYFYDPFLPNELANTCKVTKLHFCKHLSFFWREFVHICVLDCIINGISQRIECIYVHMWQWQVNGKSAHCTLVQMQLAHYHILLLHPISGRLRRDISPLLWNVSSFTSVTKYNNASSSTCACEYARKVCK